MVFSFVFHYIAPCLFINAIWYSSTLTTISNLKCTTNLHRYLLVLPTILHINFPINISATEFIWRVYQQNSATERKDNVAKITLIVEDIDGVAYASNNEIHLSARYIGSYSGDVKREITGVLYHESTHIWQWNGNGQAPGGLIEGIADFVRLRAGYDPSHWVKPGGGDRWDQGYDVRARFLDYCNDLRNGFVADLNEKMRTGYSDNFFVELLGKTVDRLWSDYKAKYGN